MRRIIAAVAALLALAGEARAQYASAYVQAPVPRYTYVYPARPAYVTGYQTVVPQYQYQYPYRHARQPNPTGYQNRPYYGAYGYGNYSNGSTDGFPPFRGRGWR